MKFIYKDREYTWDEWKHDYHNFVQELELPNDFLVDTFYRNSIIAHDKGYSIALEKLCDLYYLIGSARSALMNAYQKFYESNIISFDDPYISHLWMRAEYLKNSIIWYNSCEDYVYQMLWFGYGIHGNPMRQAGWYEQALRDCEYKEIKIKLQRHGTKEAKALLSIIKNYRFNKNVEFLRDQLANNLKHRANLQFAGLQRNRLMRYEERDKKNDTVKFSTEWIQPKVIDIDETIDILKGVHKTLLFFVREIIDYMDVYNVLEKNEDGVYKFNVIRDKSKYKKIIF